MRTMTASLRLVHAPLSNQHADMLRGIKTAKADSVKRRLGDATIYMIAQRQEIFFDSQRFDEESGLAHFELVLGQERMSGRLNVASLSRRYGDDDCSALGFLYDKHTLAVTDVDEFDKATPVWAASPDSVLYQYWRGDPDIELDRNIRDFTSFRLLYIGMSEDDAYKRLIDAPHHARLSILTNEYQIRAEARLSDELYFFLFEIDALHIHSLGGEDEVDERAVNLLMGDPGVPDSNLICDVEKAFIKMLDTKYNNIKYKKYPKVAGGLFDQGLDSYAYVIAEDITFDVRGQVVTGGYGEGMPSSNEADFILVSGNTVTLVDVSEELEAEYPQ